MVFRVVIAASFLLESGYYSSLVETSRGGLATKAPVYRNIDKARNRTRGRRQKRGETVKYLIGRSEKSINTYSDYTEQMIEGGIFTDSTTGTRTGITDETIEAWFSAPEENYQNLINYMMYMYISDGFVHQLYTLFKSLPKLNYRIRTLEEKGQGNKEKLMLCDRALHNVRYKVLARDIIGQLCATGTLICIWLGNKKSPYLYIFDNNDYVFTPFRRNGEWQAVIDLSWLESMQDAERERMYETFKEIKLKAAYEKYSSDGNEESRYLELPQEKTSVLKFDTVLRNQRVGFPLGIQSLFDINHKKELRRLETNIINKIIKSIAVLTIGDKDHDYTLIGENMKRKIISSVKSAIANAENTKKVPTTILPNYASLQFPSPNGTDVFKDGADKFAEVNNSIRFALGLAEEGSNYQSSKLKLELLYNRIDVILEDMQQVFQKLFHIILSKKDAENYIFEFVTGVPLATKDELDTYIKLHAEGMSYKSIIDMLPSLNYMEAINDTVRENNDLDFRETLVPPKTSSTLSKEDSEKGRPTEENPLNEETIKSQESGGNLIDGGAK